MQGAHWWLVCYDVREPDRLRKAARHLQGYGEGMQYSVFRCWLTERALQHLRWELTELLAAEDDELFIPLCGRCVEGIRRTHTATRQPDWPDEPERHTFV
jgi:CRISPR-associated protein Cas2